MTDIYNLTNFTNANNIAQQIGAMNTLSGGAIATVILFVLFLGLVIAMKKRDTDTVDVFLTVGTIISILSVFMWAIGWVHGIVVLFPVVITVGAIIAKSTQG